jgi:hypothetical protein
MRPTLAFVSAGLLLASSAVLSDVRPEPAMHAPLASRALLLDAARVGDGAVVVGAFGHVHRVGAGQR